jgi:signal transduction histidine kinase
MKNMFSVNSVLGDLDLLDAEVDCTDKLMDIYRVFERNINLPGIIVKKNGSFYRMLSKSKFYQVMSKQYMFDLFSRRTVEFFFDDSFFEPNLVLSESSSIIEAAGKALLREDKYRFDPIIVITNANEYKLLSIHTLLLAQNEVQKHMLELLTEANEFKKDVLGIVTHDLRNPLSAILGFVSLMKRTDFDISEINLYTEQIQISAESMRNMITYFLQIAINDSTDFELHKTTFDLVSLIETVINNFKSSLTAKSQSLLFQPGVSKTIIEGDRHRLTEVIENLISNAIKYSPKEATIFVDVKVENEKVLFLVKDNGLGISISDMDKIFGKFQKLSSKPTGNETSTGLGLYIVKKIIEKHDGKIWVESELDKGSTFYVSLPMFKQTLI